jgi:uncharacterized protein
MRVVLDTNVFVSMLLRPGDTFLSLIDRLDGHATVLFPTETLDELEHVLTQEEFSKYTNDEEFIALMRWTVDRGELIWFTDQNDIYTGNYTGSRDPKDDKFPALAIVGKAGCLASGEKNLPILGHIGEIPILSPTAFFAAVTRHGD